MEQIGATLQSFGFTQNVTSHVTNHASYEEKANHVNTSCTYDVIPKREYGLLLRKMESWGITAPKAIVKKYGVFIVKRAVEYTEHTPNVRNKAGYMTYMCGQFKNDATVSKMENVEPTNEKSSAVVNENLTTQNLPSQSPRTGVKSKKGIFTPPNIIKWQDARDFLCKLTDEDLQDAAILEFTNRIKRQFNFA